MKCILDSQFTLLSTFSILGVVLAPHLQDFSNKQDRSCVLYLRRAFPFYLDLKFKVVKTSSPFSPGSNLRPASGSTTSVIKFLMVSVKGPDEEIIALILRLFKSRFSLACSVSLFVKLNYALLFSSSAYQYLISPVTSTA